MRKLSERQRSIMRCIEASLRERGYPPSIREIGDRVGISSTSVVDYNLRVLEREGLIRRDRDVSRGLDLVGASRTTRMSQPNLVRVPVIGRIAAGVPIEPIEDVSDYVEFALGSVPEECFGLRVVGTSMIEDHIEDGDVVVVQPQPGANNGDIVVAVIEGAETLLEGATLKRFYQEGKNVRLQPRNPDMQPIIVPAEQVAIRGRVVKLVRDL